LSNPGPTTVLTDHIFLILTALSDSSGGSSSRREEEEVFTLLISLAILAGVGIGAVVQNLHAHCSGKDNSSGRRAADITYCGDRLR
jgi:hypothetical protein